MGARTLLSGSIRRLLAAVLGGSVATGCIEFAYPDIPGIENRGGPARISARLIVTDSGRISANATLRPGLDVDGYKRPVTRPFLRVMDSILEPDSVHRDGTLQYVESWMRDPDTIAGPLTLAAPRIEGILGAPPAVEWFGLRRDGPATVRLPEHEDLVLPLAEVERRSAPPPSRRQWFLTLLPSSGGRSYRVSSDGLPPIPVSVPPRWIPEGDTVRVRLIFSQSATVRDASGDYIGAITVDSWLLWTVVVERASAARSAAVYEPPDRVPRIGAGTSPFMPVLLADGPAGRSASPAGRCRPWPAGDPGAPGQGLRRGCAARAGGFRLAALFGGPARQAAREPALLPVATPSAGRGAASRFLRSSARCSRLTPERR